MALNKAIKQGTGSGLAKNFDAKKHLANLKSAKRKNGQLYSHK